MVPIHRIRREWLNIGVNQHRLWFLDATCELNVFWLCLKGLRQIKQ